MKRHRSDLLSALSVWLTVSGYTIAIGYCFGESDLYYTPFNK